MRYGNSLRYTLAACIMLIGHHALGQMRIGQPGKIRKGPGNVHCILQAKNGMLWFGTTDQGLFRYDGKTFTNITTRDGLKSDGVFSMAEDRKGRIWIGDGDGVSVFDGKSIVHVALTFGKGGRAGLSPTVNNGTEATNGVSSIFEDRSGRLWFGTVLGVYCFDGKTFTRFLDDPKVSNKDSLALLITQGMLQDRQGNIWFATKMDGVCRFDGHSIVSFKPDGENWFRGLLEDEQGRIWIGTRYKGVYRFDGEAFKKLPLDPRFDTYTVLTIIQDRSGVIWFGTEAGDDAKRDTEGGVWRYDGKSITNITQHGGLEHPAVWSMLKDRSGMLWIGTRRSGLSRYDGRVFTDFAK